MQKNIKILTIICGIFILSACQSVAYQKDAQIADPYENFNRKVFAFNNTIDQYALKPIAQGYNFLTPSVARLLIRNELDYIQSPVSIFNSALQGDIDSFLHTTGRFLLNTTLGGFGLLDPASDFGLKPHQEDFGQTLAVWGVPNGIYYMAPFLGPLTLRDMTGRFVDMAFAPTTYIGDDIVTFNIANTALGIVEFRADNLQVIETLKASTSDFYAAARAIYLQRRNAAIKNTQLRDNDQIQPEIIDFDDF